MPLHHQSFLNHIVSVPPPWFFAQVKETYASSQTEQTQLQAIYRELSYSGPRLLAPHQGWMPRPTGKGGFPAPNCGEGWAPRLTKMIKTAGMLRAK